MISSGTLGGEATVGTETGFLDFLQKTGAGAEPPKYFDNSTTTIIYDDDGDGDDPVLPNLFKKNQNLARRKSDKYQRYLNKQAKIRRELDDPIEDSDEELDSDDDTYIPITPITPVVEPVTPVVEPTTLPVSSSTALVPYNKKSVSIARFENFPVPHIGNIRQKNQVTVQTQYALGTTAVILLLILL